ncbi:sensor histidine kinase [Neobacillus sp. K501]
MDVWLILMKFALLSYIAINSVREDISHFSWSVLAILIYFCITITSYILKRNTFIVILLLLSIAISTLGYLYLYPLFALLIPISINEIAGKFIPNKLAILLLAFIPILYLDSAIQSLYGLIAFFSFMIFSITRMASEKLARTERQSDEMRKSLQKLTKTLNENTEYIRQLEYTYKLEERNRISQEIHDKIGHSLTGALFQMEAAKRLMEYDKEKAVELLQNSINISKEGIESIRMTLKNMKPPTEQVGIHQLKLLIDQFNVKQQIKAALTSEGNLEIISAIQWKIIHENMTEALTNTMKYSHATHVSIDIKILNKMIRVEIKDNGVGTDKIKKGLGIIGMEERTASLNGKIIVDSTHGFSVTMLLPIQA